MNDYSISRPDMRDKLEQALNLGGDLYTFEDIMMLIEQSKMQSFTQGDTWIITQVDEFPRKKVLAISFVVGYAGDLFAALPMLYKFARQIGATRITGFGRDGWGKFADLVPEEGWEKVGMVYAKELTNDG
jgi:hypothetical protein